MAIATSTNHDVEPPGNGQVVRSEKLRGDQIDFIRRIDQLHTEAGTTDIPGQLRTRHLQ